MSSLRRTKSGVFSVEDAHTIAEVQEAADRGEAGKLLLPIDTLFAGYPELRADADDEKKLKNGNVITVNTCAPAVPQTNLVKLFTKLSHLSHLSQCPIVPYNEK